MDNELFELCKEVYEKTKWEGDGMKLFCRKKPHELIENNTDSDEWYKPEVMYLPEITDEMRWTGNKHYPLYTSDYLLEKLPKHLASQEKLNVTYFDEVPETGEICWRAEYTHLFADGTWDIRWEYQGNGDTPLKALLKLVIALDDAGVKL